MGMGAWGAPPSQGTWQVRATCLQWLCSPTACQQAATTAPSLGDRTCGSTPCPALPRERFSANPAHSDLISHETHFWKAHSVVNPSLQAPTRCATGRISDTQAGPLDDRAAVPRAQSEPTHHAPSRNGAEAGSRVCRPGTSHLGPGPGWRRRPFPEALGQQAPRPLLPPGPFLACLLSL